MLKRTSWAVALSLALAMTWTPQAAAQGAQSPGSLLVFQEIDTRLGAVTILTITNTHSNADVFVLMELFQEPDCTRMDVTFSLTGEDTKTFLAQAFFPQPGRGYGIARAVDEMGRSIPFNHLVGQSLWIDSLTAGEAGANAVAFLGLGDGTFTDLNGNGEPDFDGIEYERAPRSLLFPRFLGQGPVVNTDLVLIDLYRNPGPTRADILATNDNESVFSTEWIFDCWTRVNLLDISAIFSNSFLKTTDHDHSEIFGDAGQEAGWFSVRGLDMLGKKDHALLGLLVERWGDGSRSAGRPFHEGVLDPPPPAEPPTCVEGQFVVDQDMQLLIDILPLVHDPSLPIDCASLTILSPPQHGVVVPMSPCLILYTPNPGYSGPDAFTYSVANSAGLATDPCPINIVVQAAALPPECPTGVSIQLWPPNLKYVPIDLNAVAGVSDPNGLALTIVITAITQDEPVFDGPGQPNTVCDGTGVGTPVALIRAECNRRGNGRVYNIHYTATNSAELACTGIVEVTVPRTQNGAPAVDDGQQYDSTAGCN